MVTRHEAGPRRRTPAGSNVNADLTERAQRTQETAVRCMFAGCVERRADREDHADENQCDASLHGRPLSGVGLQQVYLQSGQQPEAASFVAAFAALAPAVTASATSAIIFGLMVSGFIVSTLGIRVGAIPTTSSEYGVKAA